MTRVYINGRFLTQRMSGVQRFAQEALKAMDRLLAQRDLPWRWTVLAPRGAPRPALENMDFQCVGPLQGQLWEQLTLPVAVQGHWLLSFAPTGPLAKRRQLVTIHDAAVYAVPQSYSWKFRAYYKATLPLLVRRTKMVMTVSEFSRSELGLYLNAHPDRVAVCGEGWQHVASLPRDEGVFTKHGLVPGRYILAASSITPHKNFGVIAHALEHLQDCSVVVAVVGAKDPAVFGGVDPGSMGQLKMLGHVSDGELRSLYEGARAFIHPSLYEGFGLTPLEAMAFGCPLIVSRAGALPEVCGDAALYFDPSRPQELAQLIQKTVVDEDERQRLTERGRARLALHSWDACARRYLDVMSRLTGVGQTQAA